MVLNRQTGSIEHYRFFDIVQFLRAGDVLVFNESRVIPARLYGKRAGSGGKVEILLLKQIQTGVWEALVKPGKRLHTGAMIDFPDNNNIILSAEVIGTGETGTRFIKFSDEKQIPQIGQVALPPYIHTPLQNADRYQTVYARTNGSVAAPTAGLHFTPHILENIREKGIICLPVTLHIGLDTFQPVREDNPLEHVIHTEYGIITNDVAKEISAAKVDGRRVICVGTTAVRIIEHTARYGIPLQPFAGAVNLFILPGYRFQMTDAMITNFHLPKTTLLMLVSAFAGKELIDKAYAEAIQQQYRFYSFGDAMLIL